MVAVSSCADDIDPANAWQPTDIQRASSIPPITFPEPGTSHDVRRPRPPDPPGAFAPVTETPTRDFIDYKGFWLPRSFVGHGTLAEYWACREKVAVMDLSALRKFDVTGPDAEALLQRCRPATCASSPSGRWSPPCATPRRQHDERRHGVPPGARRVPLRVQRGHHRPVAEGGQAAAGGFDVRIRDATDALHNLAVQGPKNRKRWPRSCGPPPIQPAIGEAGWFRFTAARLGS